MSRYRFIVSIALALLACGCAAVPAQHIRIRQDPVEMCARKVHARDLAAGEQRRHLRRRHSEEFVARGCHGRDLYASISGGGCGPPADTHDQARCPSGRRTHWQV